MSDEVSLSSVLNAWSAAGEAPPVAIVASIVDDLAAQSAEVEEPRGRAQAEGIWIGPEGDARADQPLSFHSLVEVLDLGLHGLLPGRTGDLMPAPARSGLETFREWDESAEVGLEALRTWLRASFGPLPSREEVARCCSASAALDPNAVTTRPTAATPRGRMSAFGPAVEAHQGESHGDADAAMDDAVAAYHAAGSELQRVSSQGSARDSGELPIPEPISEAEEDSGERTVVRRESRRDQPISINRAPAARRSAAPRGKEGDSIFVPSDGSPFPVWAVVLVGLGLGVGAFFLLM